MLRGSEESCPYQEVTVGGAAVGGRGGTPFWPQDWAQLGEMAARRGGARGEKAPGLSL